MPIISVIIPAYNAEKTIKETIESVLNQTVTDFEVLVINDGSTDGTLDVIAGIKDERLRVFSYPHAGVATTRNRGLAHAVGEYISFLDADDLWTPDKLEAQLKALQENPQAAVAYSWTDWIDELRQFLRAGGYITENGQVYEKLLVRDFIESGSNPLIRAEAFQSVGKFDESLEFSEDWDMWLRLAACYEFVAVPSAQILYRISPNSASFNVWKMEAGSLRVLEKAWAQAPPTTPNLKRKILANRYQYLTLKALDGQLERCKGFVAIRFFGQAIIHDLTWLRRGKLMGIILLKIGLATLLPREQAQGIRKRLQSFRSKHASVKI
ncbi:glycosyltransferase [Coleofasciculus chthonoplastes]|jgi:glycosyltransferase involved in cell wall biosynthesis|uniref:glycosyltransferase n=1 Tax=Coleofasciculus chthonoplastes TaxID=64178 RepID=UPI0032F65F45